MGKDSLEASHHPVVARSRRTPASTNQFSSDSPIRDGTYSSLRWATTSAFLGLFFFGFVAPLFGAISQIWLGFGGGGNCGCGFGGARSEEEDEVEKVGTGIAAAFKAFLGIVPAICAAAIQGFFGNRSRDLPHRSAFKGFLGTVPVICTAAISPMR